MFNSIAYSQITGISRLQKSELAKGVIAYDDCREAYEKLHQEKSVVELDLNVERKINDTYKTENTELVGQNAILTKDNKKFKSETILLKFLGFGLGIIGFYIGTQQ